MKVIKEDIENLERVKDKQTVQNVVMADAEEESKIDDATDKLINPMKRKKERPFLGAKQQETPDKVKVPPVAKASMYNLDESLFEDLNEYDFMDFNSDFYNAIADVLFKYRDKEGISRKDVEKAYAFFDSHFYDSDDNENVVDESLNESSNQYISNLKERILSMVNDGSVDAVDLCNDLIDYLSDEELQSFNNSYGYILMDTNESIDEAYPNNFGAANGTDEDAYLEAKSFFEDVMGLDLPKDIFNTILNHNNISNDMEMSSDLDEALKKEILFLVYELDEDGEELDDIKSFTSKEAAIKFAKKQSFPTHVVIIPNPIRNDESEIEDTIRDEFGYEPYEVVWSSIETEDTNQVSNKEEYEYAWRINGLGTVTPGILLSNINTGDNLYGLDWVRDRHEIIISYWGQGRYPEYAPTLEQALEIIQNDSPNVKIPPIPEKLIKQIYKDLKKYDHLEGHVWFPLKESFKDPEDSDLWSLVYEELCPTNPNFKNKTKFPEVQFSDRYMKDGMLEIDRDANIIVYGKDENAFNFAKQVCDSYGCEFKGPFKSAGYKTNSGIDFTLYAKIIVPETTTESLEDDKDWETLKNNKEVNPNFDREKFGKYFDEKGQLTSNSGLRAEYLKNMNKSDS